MTRAKRPYEGTDAYNAGIRDAEKRLKETSEWVWDDDAIDWGIGAWVCKSCHCRNDNIPHQSKWYPYNWAGTKYCPNCGKRMLPSDVREGEE